MTDLLMLGSFLAGTFEFTLEALRAVGYCFEIYFWLLIAALLIAVGIVLDKDK